MYLKTWCSGSACDPCIGQYFLTATGNFNFVPAYAGFVGEISAVRVNATLTWIDEMTGNQKSRSVVIDGSGVYAGTWSARATYFLSLQNYYITADSAQSGNYWAPIKDVTSIAITLNKG